ncbi:MAG: hypothetical protein ABL963_17005, partial [Longimicrobiales bacterium]
MPEAEGLRPGQARTQGSVPLGGIGVSADTMEGSVGVDYGREHATLYVVLMALLVAGSVVLRRNLVWDTGPTNHTILESTATLLAFIIGGLALVRFYSR